MRTLASLKEEPVIKNLQMFQVSTKMILPSMQFEVEVHKNRVEQLQKHTQMLEAKVEHYVEQQGLYKLVRDDLEKYKKIFEFSKQLETIYSPFTPLQQYKKEHLVQQKQKNDIIDLSQVVFESSKQVDNMKAEIEKLKKDNSKLRKEAIKLDKKDETLNTALETEKNNHTASRKELMIKDNSLKKVQGELAELEEKIQTNDQEKKQLLLQMELQITSAKTYKGKLEENQKEMEAITKELDVLKKVNKAALVSKLATSDVKKFEGNPLEEVNKDL